MNKYHLKRWVKVTIILIIILGINAQPVEKSSKKIAKKHNKVANTVQKTANKCKETAKRKIEVAEAEYDPPVEEQIPDIGKVLEEPVQDVATDTNVTTTYETRMTSYYPEEDTDCTGSGLCSWDFETNEFGWYTYQGKLVVATATEYLLKYGFTLYDGVHTYRYYDEITLNIDGVDYPAIVLDSCGSSMKTDRIDLFVNNANSVKDTQIIVKR